MTTMAAFIKNFMKTLQDPIAYSSITVCKGKHQQTIEKSYETVVEGKRKHQEQERDLLQRSLLQSSSLNLLSRQFYPNKSTKTNKPRGLLQNQETKPPLAVEVLLKKNENPNNCILYIGLLASKGTVQPLIHLHRHGNDKAEWSS